MSEAILIPEESRPQTAVRRWWDLWRGGGHGSGPQVPTRRHFSLHSQVGMLQS